MSPAEKAEDARRLERYAHSARLLSLASSVKRSRGVHRDRWLHLAVTWELPYGRDNVLTERIYR